MAQHTTAGRPRIAVAPTPELRAHAHEHALAYFKYADARLTSIIPVLSSIVPVGLWAAMIARWPSLNETTLLVSCTLASLLFYCAICVVLAYSHAYEHLVALGTAYRQRAGGQGTAWDEVVEKYTPSVPKALNFGILAPGMFRPLAWMYFAGMLASEAAAIQWLSVNQRSGEVWIPADVGIFLALAAFATNRQYLLRTARTWGSTGDEPDSDPSSAH